MPSLATAPAELPAMVPPTWRTRPSPPVLSLEDVALPSGSLSLKAEVGDIVVIDGLTADDGWRMLAIAAGYAFGGPGRCEHGGVDPWTLTPQQRASLRSRMVSRAMLRDYLDAQSSLIDNVLALALERGTPEPLAYLQAVHVLDLLGLRALQHALADALSPAQQRLGVLARALACHTPLLVLERPEVGLDESQVARLRNALWLAAFDTRSCVVMTTESAALASLAQRHVGPTGLARN